MIRFMLNRDLYKFSSVNGGSYKNIDNVIEETLPNGSKYIRFKPVDAFSTPGYMDRLWYYINNKSLVRQH